MNKHILTTLTQYRGIIATGLALLLTLITLVLQKPSAQTALSKPLPPVNFVTCPTTGSADLPDFTILLVSFSYARDITQALCTNPAMQSHFHQVSAYWYPRKNWEGLDFYSHSFDMILFGREYQIKSMELAMTTSYQAIANLKGSDLKVNLISKNLSATWQPEELKHLSLGLLDEKNSISRYKLPLTALQQLGLQENELNIKLFSSNHALREAFDAGDIDLIPIIGDNPDPSLSSYYLGKTTGLATYLKSEWVNKPAHCAVRQWLTSKEPDSFIPNVDLVLSQVMAC